MNLSFSTVLLLALSGMLTGACSFFSNTVDTIKIECGTDRVETDRSYVKVLDSEGKVLRSSEFALRWLDNTGRPLATNGNCIEMDPAESAALIVRSRIGSDGLIFEADARDKERLSVIQLDAYSYGRLQKTCDQALNSNQLNLGLPVTLEDHSASGYEIKAAAIMDGKAKADWAFVNGGPANPNLDIGSLSNGRYDLRFEVNPLFSEGAVAQIFNCELVIDRKSPQIAFVSPDGSFLSSKLVELRPNSRVAWQSTNKTATELVEYCFVAAGTDAASCSTPSISNDPIVIPESGSWKFIYRGIDAANNRSDWVAVDIDVIDEAKLAEIRNKLELARLYQKAGQTQLVAFQLLQALDAYRSLSSDNERKRVKKNLDVAIFQHHRDAREFFVAQWGAKELVDYMGTLRRSKDHSTHVFVRATAQGPFGLSFIRDGSFVHPEVSLTDRLLTATCSTQGLSAFAQESSLQIFDGNSMMTLPGFAQLPRPIKKIQFSEDCRFVVMTDSIHMHFLIDRITGKTVEFPEFESDSECRFSFALGDGDSTRYYSYCGHPNRNTWKLQAFSAAGAIETPKIPLLNKMPLQLISQENVIFVLTSDKSFAVLDQFFNTLFSAPAGRIGELMFDGLRQQVLARYDTFGLYEVYETNREGGPQGPVKKLPLSELRIPTPAMFGNGLTVSQPSFAPNLNYTIPSFAADVSYARMDDSTNSFFGQLPVDRDRLLGIDFADQVLVQSGTNVFREIAPNSSLLRRNIRTFREEFRMFSITSGTRTAFYTMKTRNNQLNRYEFNAHDPFTDLTQQPFTSRPRAEDQIYEVFPYGTRELALLKSTDKLQFIVPADDGRDRTVDLTIPPTAQAIPTGDPDLFWFHVPSNGSLYTVRASTGEALAIDSFQSAVASVAKRPVSAATRIFKDPFAGHLYLTYPNLVIKLRFHGPLDKPNFASAETKTFKSAVNAFIPSRDFKTWFGLIGMNLEIYDESLELQGAFNAFDVFGKRNYPSYQMIAPGLDPDTVFAISTNGEISRVDIKTKVITSVAMGPDPYSNQMKNVEVDANGRLHYVTSGDWFTLPLDLDENRAHLCRYLGALGNRMYPEIKSQFKQASCEQP